MNYKTYNKGGNYPVMVLSKRTTIVCCFLGCYFIYLDCLVVVSTTPDSAIT